MSHKLREIVAEHIYNRDNGLSAFVGESSTTRDVYTRKAKEELPQLLSGYFSDKNDLKKLVNGSIKSYIAAHGNNLTLKNYSSLSKRIIGAIKGSTASEYDANK